MLCISVGYEPQAVFNNERQILVAGINRHFDKNVDTVIGKKLNIMLWNAIDTINVNPVLGACPVLKRYFRYPDALIVLVSHRQVLCCTANCGKNGVKED